MMNTSKVVDLNNSAVAALKQGRHKQAATLLRTAISDLKNHFVVLHKQEPRFSSSSEKLFSGSSDEMHSVAPVSSSYRVDPKQGVPLWTDESLQQKDDDKTLIFLYAQALVLAQVDPCKETLIAVVLYNMALANHTLAIETETSRLLTVALKFYGMAVLILQGQNDVDFNTSNTSNYWLLLALYNNMAKIYLSQACSEKLRYCLGNIEALLAADRIGQVIDGEDYVFFLTNAMLQLSVVAAQGVSPAALSRFMAAQPESSVNKMDPIPSHQNKIDKDGTAFNDPEIVETASQHTPKIYVSPAAAQLEPSMNESAKSKNVKAAEDTPPGRLTEKTPLRSHRSFEDDLPSSKTPLHPQERTPPKPTKSLDENVFIPYLRSKIDEDNNNAGTASNILAVVDTDPLPTPKIKSSSAA
jgi:hypothetical protein